jgi:hypothetical protein
MIVAMSDHVTIDSSDTIVGYPIVRQHPHPDGRVVVCDRGEQYRQRYVVAWQPFAYRGWCDPVFVERFDVAVEVFCVRVRVTRGSQSARE